MTNHLVGKNVSLSVAHRLVDLDDELPVGAVGEADRLNARVDHRPLTRPVAAHSIPSMNVAAVHSICPGDVLVHGREHSLHVAGVEPVVNTFEKLYLAGHPDPIFLGYALKHPDAIRRVYMEAIVN